MSTPNGEPAPKIIDINSARSPADAQNHGMFTGEFKSTRRSSKELSLIGKLLTKYVRILTAPDPQLPHNLLSVRPLPPSPAAEAGSPWKTKVELSSEWHEIQPRSYANGVFQIETDPTMQVVIKAATFRFDATKDDYQFDSDGRAVPLLEVEAAYRRDTSNNETN